MSYEPILNRGIDDARDSTESDGEFCHHVDIVDDASNSISGSDQETLNAESFDPFLPLENTRPSPILNIVTPRAILLGSLCGALVNASNIYLGLRAGWTSSANILGVCCIRA
jgi:hypothetical protein